MHFYGTQINFNSTCVRRRCINIGTFILSHWTCLPQTGTTTWLCMPWRGQQNVVPSAFDKRYPLAKVTLCLLLLDHSHILQGFEWNFKSQVVRCLLSYVKGNKLPRNCTCDLIWSNMNWSFIPSTRNWHANVLYNMMDCSRWRSVLSVYYYNLLFII